MFQIYFVLLVSIHHLLTGAGQRSLLKSPLSGIAVYLANDFFCNCINLISMKLLSESFRNFFEGFASFYTSIYNEMRNW